MNRVAPMWQAKLRRRAKVQTSRDAATPGFPIRLTLGC